MLKRKQFCGNADRFHAWNVDCNLMLTYVIVQVYQKSYWSFPEASTLHQIEINNFGSSVVSELCPQDAKLEDVCEDTIRSAWHQRIQRLPSC